MVDPLTTFAAAGNALQFVVLGVELIGKTIEYSRGGGDNEYQVLQDLSQRLAASNIHLQASMKSNAATGLPPGPARALYLANKECLGASKDFIDLVDTLGLNKPKSVWKSVRLALKTAQTRRDLEILSRRVEHARSNLTLSLLICMQDPVSANHNALNDQHKAIITEAEKITTAGTLLDADIQALSSKFSELDSHDDQLKAAMEDTLTSYERFFLREGRQMSSRLQDLSSDLASIFHEVRHVINTLDREVVARREILNSLYFPKMNDRRNRIVRAHRNTYQWIFRRKEDDNVVWDDFMQWLTGEERVIYWISGKPGSGKTTLIHELDEEISNQAVFNNWLNGHSFLKVSCYFWYAGALDEKSMIGFLKSLVFQLMQQRLNIIDKVISTQRWQTMLSPQASGLPWQESELIGVVQEIVRQTRGEDRILLFIDGLDEYDGPDEERDALLELLGQLADNDHVKLCVASRPWNIFKDAFEGCPQLRLEDLTKPDIRRYVYDRLGEDIHFQRQLRREPSLLEKVADEILGKARGVFLWVRLAVRDLLRVLRDGGRQEHLFRELNTMPDDLDEYFRRILNSIEKPYRREASAILQTSICKMDYEQDDSQDHLLPGPDFLLMHLHFLDRFENNSHFSSRSCGLPVDFGDPEDVEDFLVALDRMLASRCMGLLEVDPSEGFPENSRSNIWLPRVEFLHRTVKDFLMTRSARSILHEYTDGPFEAHLFRCNLLIVEMEHRFGKAYNVVLLDSLSCFFRHIQKASAIDGAPYLLFEKMVSLLQQSLSAVYGTSYFQGGSLSFATLAEFTQNCNDRQDNALAFAIHLKWKAYVQSRLSPRMVQRKKGWPLLTYALRPCDLFLRNTDPWFVRQILRMGTDINVSMEAESPAWVFFLASIQFIEAMDYSACFETMKLLLTYDPHLRASQVHILSAFSHVALYSKMVLELFPETNEQERDVEILEAIHSTLIPRLRLVCPEMIDTPLDQRFYTFMQILRCFTPVFGPMVGLSLFSETDLAELDALASKEHGTVKRKMVEPDPNAWKMPRNLEDDDERPRKLARGGGQWS